MKIDELVVGGAVSVPFTLLYDAVKLAVKTNNEFKSLFQALNSTMETLNHLAEEAKATAATAAKKKDVELTKEAAELKKLMEKGEVLVKKCSKVGKFNLCSKFMKSNKLRNLDQEIKRYFGLEVPMRTLMGVNQVMDVLRKLKLDQDQGGKRKRYVKLNEVYRSPEAPEFVVGMDKPFNELKEKLLQKGVSGHVVTGPGGYGKTTLASQLIHHPDVKEIFKKNIFFLCVSESQSSLAEMVQLMYSKIDKEKVPDIETEAEALSKLEELLTTRGLSDPVLVVLDDVWPESQVVLEKFECKSIPHYKILVTSRFSGFKKFGTPLQLEGLLTDEDALKLFLHSATPAEGTSSMVLDKKSPQYQIAKEIVEYCKKSPLALTVVGRSLSVCCNDLQQWINKRDQLSEGTSLVATESKILHCLEKSLHDLSSTHYKFKECFMDLGLFPEDHKIPAQVLIDIWDELYGLGANGVHAVAILHQLLYRNLIHLLRTREHKNLGDGFYGYMYVKQHDFLRQLAINQNNKEPIEQQERIYLDIRKNRFPEWLKEGRKALKARAVSICTDSQFSSTWPDMEFPAIEVLILNFQTKNYSLPTFMQKMVTLKTLVVVNNGFVTVEPSNFAMVASLPNLKKISLRRIQLPLLISSIHAAAVFKNLEKLSVFMCSVIDNLLSVSKAFPKLEEIDISYCSELKKLPDEICEVKTLAKISITDCHELSELPSELGSLENVEVLRVASCARLESLPNSVVKLKKLGCLDISGCKSIWKLPEKIGELENLKVLQMNNGCEGLGKLPESVIYLEQLKSVTCDAERAALWKKKQRLNNVMVIVEVKEEHNLGFLDDNE